MPVGAKVSGDAATEAGSFDAGLPNPAAYADVNIPMDFTSPVSLPPPDPTVTGDTTDLVGSWIELNADGTQCTLATARDVTDGTICTHLEIKRGPDGVTTGSVYREADPGDTTDAVPGPFAPATDPNIGYPTKVSPDDYDKLRQAVSGNVHYRLFDGALTNGTFTFWFSPFDLWSDWCALQSSYVWMVNGDEKYRCVPQTADAATTDLGKLALCTSAEDGPMCPYGVGMAPCVCVNALGYGGPLCGSPVCECTDSACSAALRSSVLNGTFELQGGKLVGFLDVSPPTRIGPTTLEKVGP